MNVIIERAEIKFNFYKMKYKKPDEELVKYSNT